MMEKLVCIPASMQVTESRLSSPLKVLSMVPCIKCSRGMFFLELIHALAKFKGIKWWNEIGCIWRSVVASINSRFNQTQAQSI